MPKRLHGCALAISPNMGDFPPPHVQTSTAGARLPPGTRPPGTSSGRSSSARQTLRITAQTARTAPSASGLAMS